MVHQGNLHVLFPDGRDPDASKKDICLGSTNYEPRHIDPVTQSSTKNGLVGLLCIEDAFGRSQRDGESTGGWDKSFW